MMLDNRLNLLLLCCKSHLTETELITALLFVDLALAVEKQPKFYYPNLHVERSLIGGIALVADDFIIIYYGDEISQRKF